MTGINDENHSFAWVHSFGTLAPTAIKIVVNLGNPTVTLYVQSIIQYKCINNKDNNKL